MGAFHSRLLVAVIATALAAVLPASAHVRVSPSASKPGATETYSMAVPTEGKVTTTKVELVLPKSVTLVSVDDAGKPYDVRHAADGATVITWQTQIEPSYAKIFKFVAKNPSDGAEISWLAHQYFADGTQSDWVDVPGSRRPASVTKLVP
jgi:uncharacterized protein YcnI